VRKKRYLIVNADDFGLSRSVNRGVIEAHEQGIVTSASLMVDRPAALEAAVYARERGKLDLGLHAELDAWRVARLPRKGTARSRGALERHASEQLKRQLERFRSLVGRDPSHLDSHQHRHLREVVRPVFERSAHNLGIPLRRVDARIRFCGEFYGHDGNGRPDPQAIAATSLTRLLETLGEGITELCCHPGYADDLDDWYRGEREQEVRTLCDPDIRAALTSLEIELRTFKDLRSLSLSEVEA
jgi:chitin disaccharide deacetylase